MAPFSILTIIFSFLRPLRGSYFLFFLSPDVSETPLCEISLSCDNLVSFSLLSVSTNYTAEVLWPDLLGIVIVHFFLFIVMRQPWESSKCKVRRPCQELIWSGMGQIRLHGTRRGTTSFSPISVSICPFNCFRWSETTFGACIICFSLAELKSRIPDHNQFP